MRNSLRKVEGVTNVEVDLEEKIASIVVQNTVDTATLVAATTNVGFPSTVQPPEH